MSEEQLIHSILESYFEEDPSKAARQLEVMDEDEVIHILMTLSYEISFKVFLHFNDAFAAKIIEGFPEDFFRQIVGDLDSDRSTGIFMRISEKKRAMLLDMLSEKKKEEIQELLTYPEGSAGNIMSVDYTAFHSEIQVKHAVEKIRSLASRKVPAFYVYVIDDKERLIGVLNMRDLLLADPKVTLESVMRKNIFSVDSFADREEVAHELNSRRFFSVPVVDAQKKLLGVVKADAIISDVREEASEDMQKMFGAGGNERTFSPMLFSMKKRLPWLYVNLLTAFMAASVVSLFEDVIAKITILAVFLPVVAGQGGNAGAQSLAVVMRGLVMREIPADHVRRLILKESALGVLNGMLIGLVTACVTWVWSGNPYLGVVIGLGMIVNLAAAGFSGAAIPLLMKRAGLDPAQCSSIILTTITDVVGFFAFLGFAVLFERFLIP